MKTKIVKTRKKVLKKKKPSLPPEQKAEVKVEKVIISPEEQADIALLTTEDLRQLETLKSEINTELASATKFSGDSWKFKLENLLLAPPESLTPQGRQTIRLYRRLIPPEILEQYTVSEPLILAPPAPAAPAPPVVAGDPQNKS